MGGGGGDAGAAPQLDVRMLGRNQARQNAQAAIASATMSNVNQVTPFSSLTYKQTGGYTDENDQFIPQFTATQELSPEMKGLFDFGQKYLPQVQQSLMKGLPDTAGYTDDAYRALTQRSNADLDRVMAGNKAELANQGVAAGSEAYRRGLEPVVQGYVDASSQATLNAQDLADKFFNRDITRQQSMLGNYGNILELVRGGQPNFVNTPQSQVQAPDVTSPAMAVYDAQNKAYQQNKAQAQSSSNALMGGLFGLGGAALGGFLGGPFGAGIGSGLFGSTGGNLSGFRPGQGPLGPSGRY